MPKILLIDRDISQGDSIASAIRKSPLEVAVVHSVEEAAAIVRREAFDLVFLDVVAEKDPQAAVQTVIAHHGEAEALEAFADLPGEGVFGIVEREDGESFERHVEIRAVCG